MQRYKNKVRFGKFTAGDFVRASFRVLLCGEKLKNPTRCAGS